MIELPNMPKSIAALPRDSRGYPVPWFVAWMPDGTPEFRCADPRKLVAAIKRKLCWVCGEALARQHVFVIGPMCAVNHTTAEPPCHEACAEFSVRACPFLSRPKAVRREANMPEGSTDPGGIAFRRNPGVTFLWFCRGYQLADDGSGGILFHLPNPGKVRWYCEGRQATRAEIVESIETGLPLLRELAEQEGREAVCELERLTKNAMKLVPA